MKNSEKKEGVWCQSKGHRLRNDDRIRTKYSIYGTGEEDIRLCGIKYCGRYVCGKCIGIHYQKHNRKTLRFYPKDVKTKVCCVTCDTVYLFVPQLDCPKCSVNLYWGITGQKLGRRECV